MGFDVGPTLYKLYTDVLCLLSFKPSMQPALTTRSEMPPLFKDATLCVQPDPDF